MTHEIVRDQAEQIAREEAAAFGWGDAKQEILRDLLCDDQAFANAVIAQRNLARFDGVIDADPDTVDRALEGAGAAADVRENRVDRLSAAADEIVELAMTLDLWPEWTDAYNAHCAGFTSAAHLEAATRNGLVDAGLHPDAASRLVTAVEEVHD